MTALRVTVWNEGVHETTQPEIAAIYPDGIHGAIAAGHAGRHREAGDVRAPALPAPRRPRQGCAATFQGLQWRQPAACHAGRGPPPER